MNAEAPLVSICIPTYNGEKYLKEALDSAINQTYKNLEIVVSDDNSADQTLSIIESYKEKIQIPIHIYKHTPNGIGANWNHCVRQANGAYIKFLFQDDLIVPSCIAEMVAAAQKNEHIGLVFCTRTILAEGDSEYQKTWIKSYGTLHNSWDELTLKDGECISGKKLLSNKRLLKAPLNKIGEPTAVLLKKECFDSVGFFDETLKQELDLEYWYRVMNKFDVVFIDKPLVSFRLHSDQATFVNERAEVGEFGALQKKLYQHVFRSLHVKNKVAIFNEINPIGKYIFKPILGVYYWIKRSLRTT